MGSPEESEVVPAAAVARPTAGRAIAFGAIVAFAVAAFVPLTLVEPLVPHGLEAYAPYAAGGLAWASTIVLFVVGEWLRFRWRRYSVW